MLHKNHQRQLIWGAIAAVSLVLVGCGPSKTAQCREILQAVQEIEDQKFLGQQTRTTRLVEIRLYQGLIDDLAAMDIKNKGLQDHRTQMIEAYSNKITAINHYIEASNEAGHLSHRADDPQGEAAVRALLAEQMQAQNRVDLAVSLFYNTCAN